MVATPEEVFRLFFPQSLGSLVVFSEAILIYLNFKFSISLLTTWNKVDAQTLDILGEQTPTYLPPPNPRGNTPRYLSSLRCCTQLCLGAAPQDQACDIFLLPDQQGSGHGP